MLKRSKTILLLSLILVSGILSFVSAKHERHLNGNASADSGSQEDSTNAVSNDKSNEGKDGGFRRLNHDNGFETNAICILCAITIGVLLTTNYLSGKLFIDVTNSTLYTLSGLIVSFILVSILVCVSDQSTIKATFNTLEKNSFLQIYCSRILFIAVSYNFFISVNIRRDWDVTIVFVFIENLINFGLIRLTIYFTLQYVPQTYLLQDFTE